MPTISQLPSATSISAADEIPISQGGALHATSVGALLATTQPGITLASPCLLGRTSIGSGGPEQIETGVGINLLEGTLVADGLDHAEFASLPSLSAQANLVVSNDGSPMLMQASLLRGLFSAGQNVTIDTNGMISSTAVPMVSGTLQAGTSLSEIPILTGMTEQDLVAVSQAGSSYAITYSNFLSGLTIDQAQAAGPVTDSDELWTAQGNNIMTGQSFLAIWTWICDKLPTYKAPIDEVTTNTNLNAAVHNGRILLCSQPITLTPSTNNMGSGFVCTVINASTGNITLEPGFVSSNGSLTLLPWQSATLSCATYSGGTIAFAAMPAATSSMTVPGQVSSVSSQGSTSTTITLSWQAPQSGGSAASYVVQFRPSGTASWSSSGPIAGLTTYELTALQPSTSYDIVVEASNAVGTGAACAILTVTTPSAQSSTPLQVSGLTATPLSSSSIQISWLAQSGASASTSFNIQYRITGQSSWTSSIGGVTGITDTIVGLQAATSYDFSVVGVNTAGVGPVSLVVMAVTPAASQSVSSITWNLLPSGTYTHGSGAIGVNARVSPSASPIQFGFSPAASTPPSNWTAAILVNTDLWGAYVPTPNTPGNWYTWAEGLDGSASTVNLSPFVVQ